MAKIFYSGRRFQKRPNGNPVLINKEDIKIRAVHSRAYKKIRRRMRKGTIPFVLAFSNRCSVHTYYVCFFTFFPPQIKTKSLKNNKTEVLSITYGSVFQPGFRGTQRFRQFFTGFRETPQISTLFSI